MFSLYRKSIIAVFTASLLFLAGNAFAGFSGNFNLVAGANFHSDYGAALGWAIAVDTFSPGGPYVYAAGSSSGSVTSLDYIVIKYTYAGVVVASATFDSNSNSSEAKGVAVDRNGNVIVTGESYNGTSYDIVTVKYNPNLVFISSAGFDTGSSYNDKAEAVAIDGAGNIYIVGNRFWGTADIVFAKYNSNLVLLSSGVFTSTGDEYGNGISVGSNGNVYITGTTDTNNILVAKYSSNFVFVSSAAANPGSTDIGYAITLDTNNTVYVAGYSSQGQEQSVVYKYSANLVFQSSVAFPLASSSRAQAIALGPTGDVYTAGFYWNGNDDDYIIARMDNYLMFISSLIYNSGGTNVDSAQGITIDQNGNLYMTGRSGPSYPTTDIRTIKYASDLGQDSSPPSTVTGLYATTGDIEGAVNLAWSTPGDDFMVGILKPGSRYRIQYSTASNESWGWQNAQVNISTSYVSQNTWVNYTITSLQVGATYFFKIWTADEWPNWSGLSNTATAYASTDVMAPAVITNLVSQQGSWIGSVQLTWSAPGDDGWTGTINGGSFGICYSTNPFENYFNPTVVFSTSGVNPYDAQSYLIGGLDPGTTYYLKLIAGDESFNVGALSAATTAWATLPAQGTDSLTTYNGGADGWMTSFNGGSNNTDVFKAVATDLSGNIYAAGNTTGAGTDILLRKYDPSGSVLWERYYNGAANGNDTVNGVATDISGNVIVAGNINRADIYQSDNIWVRKYDGNGKVLWTNTYNSPNNADDIAYGVAVDITDTIYVVGYENRSDLGTGTDLWLRKYNSSGNVVWTSTRAAFGNVGDWGNALSAKNGSVYVTGTILDISTNYDIYVARYNAMDGLLQMATSYSSAGSFTDMGRGIDADATGNIYIAASYYDPSQTATLAWMGEFNSSGVLLETATYRGAGTNNAAQSITSDNIGAKYFTGREDLTGSAYRVWTSKINQAGLTQWTTTYEGSGADDKGNGIVVVGSSMVYVVGTTYVSGQAENAWLRKYVQVYPNAIPTGLWSSAQTATSLRWDWTDNAPNEAGYRVKLSSVVYNPASNSHSGNLAPNTTYWIQTDLQPNTSYGIYVEAFTYWGSTSSARTSKYTEANSPANLRVIGRSSNTISMQWDANSNPGYTQYVVWYSTDDFSTDTRVLVQYTSVFTGYTTTHFNLDFETTYYYKAGAYNQDGSLSNYSNTTSTITPDTISPPTMSLSANPGSGETQIVLQWSAGGDNGYDKPLSPGSEWRIQYSTYSAYSWNLNTAQIVISTSGIAPALPVNYTVKNLIAGATYYLKIWIGDEVPNWSALGPTATSYASGFLPVHTWDGGGLTQFASEDENWVNDSAPDSGDRVDFTVVYNVKNCNWDLPIAVSTMFVQAAYAQPVTISSFVYITNYLDFEGDNLFTVNASSIALGGNLYVQKSGLFDTKTSTIAFIGTSDQWMTLPTGATFWSMDFITSSNVYCQNTRVTVKGNIYLAGVTFETSGSTVNFRGDMSFNTGWEVQQTSGKWILDGTKDQNFGPANSIFANLDINKVNGSTVTLNTALKVSGDLNLIAGSLNQNGSFLQVGRNLNIISPARIYGAGEQYFVGSNDSYVNIPQYQKLDTVNVLKNYWSYSVILSTSPVRMGSVKLTQGTLDLANSVLYADGIDRTSTGELSVAGSTVIITGDNFSLAGTTLPFNVLIIDNPGATTGLIISTGIVSVKDYLRITPSSYLNIPSGGKIDVTNDIDINGKFEIAQGTVGAFGNITVNSGGSIDMSNLNQGIVSLAGTLNFREGSILKAASESDLICSTSIASNFNFTVTGGSVQVSGLTLSGLGVSGLDISSYSYVMNLSSVAFVNCKPYGKALNFKKPGTGQYVFNGFDFDSSVSTNVYVPSISYPGYIKMLNATGAKAGYDYEYDPNNVVFWSTATPPISFMGTNMSTNSITWVWNDVPDTLFYRVFAATGGMVSTDMAESTNTWTEAGLTPNTSYQRYVDVYNPIGVSTASPYYSIYTNANKPLGSYISGRSSWSITLDWQLNNNPSPNTEYVVNYTTHSDFVEFSSASYYTPNLAVTGLDPYTTYYFKIRAKSYNTSYSGYDTLVTTVTHPPYVAPVSTVTFPVSGGAYNSLAVIAGTSYVVAPATIAVVFVELYNSTDNLFYDGSGFNTVVSSWLAATGKTTWSYAVPALTTNKLYRIRVYAKDDYNRNEPPTSQWFITFDTGSPNSQVLVPNNNGVYTSLASISGTAADAETSVNDVEIRLHSMTNNNNYDGTQWVVNPSTWLLSNYAANNWTYNLPALTSGYYIVNSRALDTAGNYQAAITTTTFYILGHATRLLAVAPGQTLTQGLAPGKTGSPIPQVAGIPLTLSVYAVDTNYFIDATTNSFVTVTSNDPWATPPSPQAVVSGSTTFTMTLVTAANSLITAQANGLLSDTTGFAVAANVPTRLQLLVPGLTAAPGSPTGKMGSQTSRTAGIPFNVTVNLTDNYWNVSAASVTTISVTVPTDSYSTTPLNQPLFNGSTVFTMDLVVASTQSILAADVTGVPQFISNSSTITVIPNAGTKLLVLLPGESFAPGKSSLPAGRSGSTSPIPILQSFQVTVRATDNWWNLQSASNTTVMLLTTDPLDSNGGGVLAAGEGIFPMQFVSEGAWVVNATDVNYGLLSSTSSSVTATDLTPPCAVSNLTSLKGPGHGTVRLMWTAPGDDGAIGNITGGQIWIRYTDAGQITDFNVPLGSWAERLIISTDTVANSPQTIIMTGLTPWVTYYFALKVTDGGQWGSWSTSGVNTAAYSLAQDTAVPIITDLQTGDYTWRNLAGNTYNVDFQDNDSGLGSIEYAAYTGPNLGGTQLIAWTQITSVSGASYNTDWGVNFNQLVEYTTNYISVRAFDIAGNSTTTYDVFSIFKDTTPPDAPLLDMPLNGATDIVIPSLNWSDSNEEIIGSKLASTNRYRVEINQNADGTGPLNSAFTVIHPVDLPVTDGLRYWRVRTYDNAGNFSAWSSTRSLTVVGTSPVQPTGFMGTALSTASIKWEWQDNATNETSYRVRLTTGPGYPNPPLGLPVDTTYYIQANLTPNSKWDRYVVAHNSIDDSNPSNAAIVYTLANPPQNTAFTGVAYSSVSVNWSVNNNPAFTKYEVQWTTDNTFTVVDATSSLFTGNFYTINGLTTQTTYYIRVRAINEDLVYTTYNTIITTITPVGPPAQPSNLFGLATSTTSITWHWDDMSTTETGFRIYSSTGGLLATLGTDVTTWIDAGLTPNFSAFRNIKAYNGSGESSAFPQTVCTIPLPPESIASTAQTPTTITLTWTAGSGGAARYYIERSPDNVTYTPIANWGTNVAVATYQDLNRIQNTTYYYRLGAYNNDQMLSALSDSFAVKTQDAPKEKISGKVTQSDGTPITGVEIKATKSGSNLTYTVYTSTGGEYEIELYPGTEVGTYKIQASWTANDVISSVYKDGIANGTGGVNFTLEVKFVLATVSGQVALARSPSIARKAIGGVESYGYVELIQNGKVICKLPLSSEGKYFIPNLLPGKYSIRAFNGVAYSKTAIVDLKEGDNASVQFTYDLLHPDKVYAYPNPAADVGYATLHFETSGQDIDAQINIYTISGELVKTVGQEKFVIIDNIYEYRWDLTNNDNNKVASAVYIYNVKVRNKATAEAASVTKKMAVVR